MTVSRELIGNTRKVSWVNSGVTVGSLTLTVYANSEVLVDSSAMVDSGNGHWYGLHTIPNTPGFYVVQTLGIISNKPYKNRFKYQAVLEDVN